MLVPSAEAKAGKVAEMNRDYDLASAEMNVYLDYADSPREIFQEKLIQIHFQAKNLMRQQQWKAMYIKLEEKK